MSKIVLRVLTSRTTCRAVAFRRAFVVPISQRQIHHTQIRQASTDDHRVRQVYSSAGSTEEADREIEVITELYATAQDEFEIAMEETEKVSVYAEEDRKAAREELTKVQEAYNKIIQGPDGRLAGEVQQRIGRRIRELEQGVKAMEELAQNQD